MPDKLTKEMVPGLKQARKLVRAMQRDIREDYGLSKASYPLGARAALSELDRHIADALKEIKGA
jgi:hypothetical protein